jgi:DNA-3-methyladenine glycosylase II
MHEVDDTVILRRHLRPPTTVIKPETLRAAEAHLKQRDRKLARVIEAYGPCTLGSKRRDPFHVLCGSIISQQLSVKAADTIQARVAAAVLATVAADAAAGGAPAVVGEAIQTLVFTPGHFLGVDHEQLRACGLSNAKARWLRALAEATHSGSFSFARLRRMDDEAAIEALDALPGVGRWTAEMFAIFALDRIDIFSMGDVGLRNALNRLHGRRIRSENGKPAHERLDDEAVLKRTARWAPYRSVASWYLWRMSDGDNNSWA